MLDLAFLVVPEWMLNRWVERLPMSLEEYTCLAMDDARCYVKGAFGRSCSVEAC